MNSTIKKQLYELISKTDIDLLDIHNIQVKALELNLFGLAVYIRDNTAEYISTVKSLERKSK